MYPQLELLGLAAGSLTAICWLPQAVRIIRSRDTGSISLWSQLAFTAGCSLWAIYGLVAGSPSIIVFNAVSATLGATNTALKIRFG